MKKSITITDVANQVLPPVLRQVINFLRNKTKRGLKIGGSVASIIYKPGKQDLDIYWDPKMAQILETWGEGNVWNEIQFLMVNCEGKVLDIACGTGKTIEIVSGLPSIDVYGCDISDFLIHKAIERGISSERLVVCDASQTKYADDYFDYAYSIGSLEHFTEGGIIKCLQECLRIVKRSSFHMIPVSRSGRDEGWMKTTQSFHNNSVEWWLRKYKQVYNKVYILDSVWEDDISVGKWFVCIK